jgi:threonine dehydratase
MFHYRNQGADYGRVLVGLQASDAEEAAFRRVVDAVGYAYEELTTTPSYRLFLSPHSKVCNSRAA